MTDDDVLPREWTSLRKRWRRLAAPSSGTRSAASLTARAFLSELDQAILRILEAPKTWPKYRSGTRRCLLERFPFSIVYREARGRIEIVAVAHAKRRPGYWRKR